MLIGINGGYFPAICRVCFVFNSLTAIAGAIIGLLFVFTIQRIWIVLGRCLFFKNLLKYFHDFWSQIGIVILVTPKQEVEKKSRVVLRREIFLL